MIQTRADPFLRAGIKLAPEQCPGGHRLLQVPTWTKHHLPPHVVTYQWEKPADSCLVFQICRKIWH